MPPPPYLISKLADPIFAVAIGVAAALVRINREEKARDRRTADTLDAGLRWVRALCSVTLSFAPLSLSLSISLAAAVSTLHSLAHCHERY